METPEKTKELYQSIHEKSGASNGLKLYNKEIHMSMLMEIEQATEKIRTRYIQLYGENAINPNLSVFDVVESEDETDEKS